MSHEMIKVLMGMGANDLKRLQAFSLEEKIKLAKANIQEWYEHWNGNVYVSFSGGKDSTVLLHLVRSMYPDVPAVFCDTGLEYPALKKFVKRFDNVNIIRPKMNFKQVITEHGYPVVSKEVSQKVFYARKAIEKGIRGGVCERQLNGEYEKSSYSYAKYKPLLDVDFYISSNCCTVMKKKPFKQYEKETNRKAILGIQAGESYLRKNQWVRFGCNVFSKTRSVSKPLSVWLEKDILQYAYKNDVELCSVYGGIECSSCGVFKTSGCDRTGCVFCGYGTKMDKGKRFKELARLEPRLYEYCIGGGEYNENGMWIPSSNGLGFAHVYDVLNKLYGENYANYRIDSF